MKTICKFVCGASLVALPAITMAATSYYQISGEDSAAVTSDILQIKGVVLAALGLLLVIGLVIRGLGRR